MSEAKEIKIDFENLERKIEDLIEAKGKLGIKFKEEDPSFFAIVFLEKFMVEKTEAQTSEYEIHGIKRELQTVQSIETAFKNVTWQPLIGQYRKIPRKREEKYIGPVRIAREKDNLVFKTSGVEEYKIKNFSIYLRKFADAIFSICQR